MITSGQPNVNFSRSWRSVWPLFVFAGVVSFVVYGITLDTSFYGPIIDFPIVGKIQLPTAFLIFLVLLARPMFALFDSSFQVGEHHLRASCGKCSWRRIDIELPFEDIQGVRASQSIIERILGVGDLLVWTASAERPELVMRGVASPQYYAKLIGKRIDAARIAAKQKAVAGFGQ